MKSETSRPTPWLAALACAGLSALLTGCGLQARQAESPAQTVQLDGMAYRVEQITASTWSARAPLGLPEGREKTATLVKAIEKASNCKVTDSSFGAQGTVLNAQVDCGSRLKN